MTPTEDHERFRELLDRAGSIVLTTHVNPDGDAIGSEVALARFLASRGKKPRIVNHDPTPPFLRFVADPDHPVEVYDPATHDPLLAAADLVVLLDNSAPDRLGRMERVIRSSADRILCIDHHPTRGTLWKHNVIDEAAAATAGMIYDLVVSGGWQPDRLAAQAVYVGLATDTGFFRFNSTTPHAHEIAAKLLRIGVDSATCYQEIYERNPPALTRLLGHALARIRIDAGGAVASIRITADLVDRCEAQNVDTSEMTTALLATDGVRVALLFRELGDGRIKVSLRSKGELDVHQLASRFGGGGHRNASGIVMPGDIGDIEARVIASAAAVVAGRP